MIPEGVDEFVKFVENMKNQGLVELWIARIVQSLYRDGRREEALMILSSGTK